MNEANKTTNAPNTEDLLSSTQDDFVQNVPEHILFPDELNRYLRDRIQVYIEKVVRFLFIYLYCL